MNIKLTEFNGLYTNADENDLKFEMFSESVNFRHEQGYARFDPNTFVQFDRCFPLPEGYTWEKGCTATLTSDSLSESMDIKSYEIFVMVCKRVMLINGEYIAGRKIFMSEYGSDVHYSLFKDEDNSLPNCEITEGDFNTWVTEKEVHFLNVDGVLKIYLPHMSFWLGRLERTLYRAGLSVPNPVNGYYFDRLVEPYDTDNLGVDVRGGITEPLCSGGRRLGFYSDISVVSTASVVTEEQTVDSTYQGLKNIGTTGFTRFDAYGFYFTDHDTGEPVAPITQLNPSDPLMHMFLRDNDTGSNYMLIPTAYANLKFGDGSTMADHYSSLAIYEPHVAPTGWYQNGQTSYRVTVEAFNADVLSLGLNWVGQTVSTTGFSNVIKKLDIVVTALLDISAEIIIFRQTVDTTTSDPLFALKFSNTRIPKNSNARITGLRIYLKALSYLDYKLSKAIDFLNPKEKDFTAFYISQDDVTDTLLMLIAAKTDQKLRPKLTTGS